MRTRELWLLLLSASCALPVPPNQKIRDLPPVRVPSMELENTFAGVSPGGTDFVSAEAELLQQERDRRSRRRDRERDRRRDRRRDEPRRTRPIRDHHRFMFLLSAGAMDASESPGALDDSSTPFLRFRFEATPSLFGGGVAIESMPRVDGRGGVDGSAYDLFGHATIRPTVRDRFRAPTRLGLYLHSNSIDRGTNNDEDLVSLGVRVEAEPEVDVFRRGRIRVSVYGALAVGTGFTLSSVDNAAGDEVLDGSETMFSTRIGVRASFERFVAGLSYAYTEFDVGRLDAEDGVGPIPSRDFEYDGFFFTLGTRW